MWLKFQNFPGPFRICMNPVPHSSHCTGLTRMMPVTNIEHSYSTQLINSCLSPMTSPQITVPTVHYGILWFIQRTRWKMRWKPSWSTGSLARTPQFLHWETGRKLGLRMKEHRKEVDSFAAGTQTRASGAMESSTIHKSAISDHAVEENHVIDWDSA